MTMTHKPTLTPEIEEQMIAALKADPDVHLVMPSSSYRTDGSVVVYRDNLSGVRAQRHLHNRVIRQLSRNEYLRGPWCAEPGCMNPYHYHLVTRTIDPPTHCPNGHAYTPENTLPDGRARCRTCYEAAKAKKRDPNAGPSVADVNRQKTHCIHGHEFTPQNTYISLWRGHRRRRCRTCAITYALETRRKAQERKES
jgi:hypothetical protein